MTDISGVDPKANFLASRAATAAGPDPAQYLLNRYGTGTDKTPATPAPSDGEDGTTPAAPQAPNANLPFGLRVEQAISQYGKKYADFMDSINPINPQDIANTVGQRGKDVASDLAQPLETERTDPLNPETEHATPLALPERAIKTAGDVIMSATSPVEGVLRTTYGRVIQALTGGKISKEQAAQDAVQIAQVAAGGLHAPETGPITGVANEGEEGAAAASDASATASAPVAEGAPAAEGGSAVADAGTAGEPAPAAEGVTTQAADATPNPSISEPVAPHVQGDGMADFDQLTAEKPEELAAAGLGRTPFTVNNENPDRISVTPELQDQFRRYLSGESDVSPVQPSLEQLGTKEGLEDAITRLASFVPREGAMADTDLRGQALSMLVGITPDQVLNGPIGSLAKDTGDLAARMDAAKILLMSSAQQFQQLARRAVATGTDEDWQAASRGYALQNQITANFTQAGTNVGRALRARQLDVFGEGSSAQAFNDIVANVGPDNVEEVIRKMADLPTPEQAAGWTGVLRRMTSRDALLYGWYNMLLGPGTILKKLTSDAVVGTMNIASRYAAEKLGPSGAVAPGETAALISGYAGAFTDGLRAAGKAFKTGHSNFMSDYQTMDGTTVTRMEKLVGDGGAPLDGDHPTSAAMAFLRAGLPTTWIGAADDLAKVVNYRAEARSLLHRQGVDQGLEGNALSQHIDDNLAAMPDDIHQQAKAAALSNTFQDPLTGLALRLQDGADNFSVPIGAPSLGWKGFEVPVGRILLPFVKVPANIMKFAYRNSPLPEIFPSAGYKADLMAGGARRDLAYARVGIGTGITVAASGLALSGNLTGAGPSDPAANAAWQRAGNMPYSIKVNGQSVGYNRIEPIGMMLSAVADSFNVAKFASEQDSDNIAGSVIFGIGSAMLSKTYLSGIANFFDALNSPEKESGRYIDNLISSMTVPNVVGGLDKATDEWRRAHYDLLGSIEAKTPGLSQGMPPVRTIWGDAIPQDQGFLPPFSGTGAARMLSPVPMRDEHPEPIDSWVWDNRSSFPTDARGNLQLPSKPGHVQTFQVGKNIDAHVALSPEQYSKFLQLAGNDLKDPNGLGAKDYLNALVAGNNPDGGTQRQWNNGSPAARALIVSTAIGKFRQAAKQQLRGEFPDIDQAVNAQATDRATQLQGPQQ